MEEVTVTRTSGLQQEVRAGRHLLLADELEAVGGHGSGLNPYELLLGALGACKSMTVSLYAARKGWVLQGVQVALSHSREYDRDCVECEQPGRQIDRITVHLTFKGELDDPQRHRLREIASRCPVHRTLENTVRIEEVE